MLGEKSILNINYEDKLIEFQFNFRSLKNLWELTNENPIQYIVNFANSKDKKNEMLVNIIYAFTDCQMTILEIKKMLKDDDSVKNKLLYLISQLIVFEISNEEESENQEATINKDKNRDYNNEFIKFWNEKYFVATKILKMTEEEFLNSTVREIITMQSLDIKYKKSILVSTISDVFKAMNGETESDNNITEVTRFKNIF